MALLQISDASMDDIDTSFVCLAFPFSHPSQQAQQRRDYLAHQPAHSRKIDRCYWFV
jgi:hypothetical protein